MRNRLLLRYFTVGLIAAFFVWMIVAARAQQSPINDTSRQGKNLFGVAEASWDNRQWEQAVAGYKRFVEQFPNHPAAAEAHSKIGEYLSYVAPPEEAIAEYEKAIAKAPGTHAAHESKTGIAALKFFLQDYEEAHRLFREVLQETKDWSLIKECVYQLKYIGRMIELQKLPNEQTAMDCGADALEAALKVRGIRVADKERNRLLTMKGGVTLEQLRESAQATGVKAWGVKLEVAQLDSVPKPFIAHVGNNHYVVVTGIKNGKVMYDDSHRGETYKSVEIFRRIWRGNALVFAKDVPPMLRAQLLTKTQMETIRGGHHLHGNNMGGSGNNPASGFENEPSNNPNGCPGLPSLSVNLSNFNLVVQDTDFAYSGRGPGVGLTRTYNADDASLSVFGRSWTFNYNVRLVERPAGMGVDVFREDGKVDFFDSRGDGTFNPPRWNHDRLTKNTDGTFALEIKRAKITQHFDAQGRLTRIVDRNGNAVTLGYDAANQLRTVTDAVNRVTRFEYYPDGKVKEVTDPLPRTATFRYNGNGDLISTTDMVGNVVDYEYNDVGYMTSVTTPKGKTLINNGTSPYFGDLRRDFVVKDLIDAENNTKHFDTGSTIAWVDDARKNRTFYFNDTQGQTTQIEDPLGNRTNFSFDGRGNLSRIEDANNRRTTLIYDARGNLTRITDALGNVVMFSYDEDNLIQSTDSIQRIYRYEYDDHANLLNIKDPTNNIANPTRGITTFIYDSFGQLRTLTDARQKTTIFDYDAQGNLKSVRNPVGSETTYTYDEVGRLKTLTDPNRNPFSYIYDGNDRLREIRQPDGSTTTYTYNCCNLSTITDASGTLTFDYDRANRLKSFTNTRNQIIRYGYDENRNLITLTYPGENKVVRYEYDAANRMKKVTDWLNNTTTYSYDPTGNLLSSVNSNGTVTGYQYDTGNRLVSLVNAKANGAVISGYKYTLSNLGNRTNIAAIEPVSPVTAQRNISHTYGDDNRIETSTGATYTHDGDGNLTAINGANPTTYSYDVFDRLTQITSPGYNAQYQYDALGNRITRTVNGTTTKYIVDPLGSLSLVLAETDDAGGITSYYVYGLELISKVTPTSQSYFYHYDGLGSTIAITNSSGDAANRYAYDPFGNLSGNSTEAVSNSFRYVGSYGVMDEGNGLLYMRARYYAPNLGRFINKDPIGLIGGLNTYQYGGNNPINFIDPLGLRSISICLAFIDGGCITVGSDSGGLFVEGIAGFGFAAGITYDPSGTFSGKPGSVANAGLGVQCDVTAGLGVSASLGVAGRIPIYDIRPPEVEIFGRPSISPTGGYGIGSGISGSAVGGVVFGVRPFRLFR
ncbi:MAG: cysteine peptidase family C39 domain-containing protein [Pyrinomonadaceae bacterium MAG19_C2-C3]|nr:cysteine peptidase family C39 domain-containing protein [Pyrinomonadaceae bacterium MAG19_C2-C3]